MHGFGWILHLDVETVNGDLRSRRGPQLDYVWCVREQYRQTAELRREQPDETVIVHLCPSTAFKEKPQLRQRWQMHHVLSIQWWSIPQNLRIPKRQPNVP
jgi:hypothetical protein